jgi:hypothetical protein
MCYTGDDSTIAAGDGVAGKFRIDYVMLPTGRIPARDFIDSLEDEAAAKVDAFIERLWVYGTRMHGSRQEADKRYHGTPG